MDQHCLTNMSFATNVSAFILHEVVSDTTAIYRFAVCNRIWFIHLSLISTLFYDDHHAFTRDTRFVHLFIVQLN